MCENKTQTTFEWIIQLPPFAPRLLLFSAPPTASIMSLFFFCQLCNGDVGTVLQKPSKYKLSYPAPQGAVIIFPLPSPAFASCTYLRPHTHLVEAPDRLLKLLLFLFYVPCVISLSHFFCPLWHVLFICSPSLAECTTGIHSCAYSCLSPIEGENTIEKRRHI